MKCYHDLLLLNMTVRDVLRDASLTMEVEHHGDLLSWRDCRDGDLGSPAGGEGEGCSAAELACCSPEAPETRSAEQSALSPLQVMWTEQPHLQRMSDKYSKERSFTVVEKQRGNNKEKHPHCDWLTAVHFSGAINILQR